MGLKSKLLAAAASLTLVGGLSLAGAITAGTASAATPSCGPSCINTYPQEYAGTAKRPAVRHRCAAPGDKTGQPIILFRQANSTRR